MQVKEIRSALPLWLVVAIAAGINICHLCNRVCKRRVSIGQEKFAIKVWTREWRRESKKARKNNI